MTTPASERFQQAVRQLAREIPASLGRSDLTCRDERMLWRELSCCILSSQVPYELATASAERIDEAAILRNATANHQRDVEWRLRVLLSAPFALANGARRYRFPNAKASQLAAAWACVRETYGDLSTLLAAHNDPLTARLCLVSGLSGLGPKQASMFLRNVGVTRDVAVIDRHVLRYMSATGLWVNTAAQVHTLPGYEAHERTLRSHARYVGCDLAVLDWAVWIVMRAASTV